MRRRSRGSAPTRRAVLRVGLALSGGALLPRRILAAAAAPAQTRAKPPRLEADVCIIGSGPAGAILACALVRHGIATLMVESGPARDAPRDPRVAELERYSTTGSLGYPLAATRFRGAGGTSNLWSGSCPRLHPIDFEPNAYTPAGAAWPLRYGDLEPYYLPAEVELSVQGVDNAPDAPPRTAPFPFATKAGFPNLDTLQRRSGAAFALSRLPRSDWHGQGTRVAASHHPELEASPYATILGDATATRVLCDSAGQVAGIRLESFAQPPRIARARCYVIACGGVESARLLLLSRDERAPAGLGNRSDQLGRNFQEHPAVVDGRGTVAGDWIAGKEEWTSTEEFLLDAKRQGLGGVRLRVISSTLPLGAGLIAGTVAPQRLSIEVKGEIEMEPSPSNRVTLADAQRDAFGNPGAQLALDFTDNDRRTCAHAETLVRRVLAAYGADDVRVRTGIINWSHHHMGTCRMGNDPATSVVDRDLRVHGTNNLFVASSGAFVTSGVSNPTLTIVALSLRLADHLRRQLRA